jgi:hypothetical protein
MSYSNQSAAVFVPTGGVFVFNFAITAILFGYIAYETVASITRQRYLDVGWLAVSAAVCFPGLLMGYLGRRFGRRLATLVDWMFFALLAVFALSILKGSFDGVDERLTMGHASNVLVLLTFYLLGRASPVLDPDYRSVLPWVLFLGGSIGMVVCGYLWAEEDEGWLFANYQGLAMCYLGLVAYAAICANGAGRLLVYCAGALCLAAVGARSELVALSLMVCVAEILLRHRLRILYLVIFAVLFVFYPLVVATLSEIANQPRLLGLIELGQDYSWNERAYAQAVAIATIASSPIFGDYGSYEEGRFAHNILSSWVDLGFIGFALMCSVLLIVNWKLLRVALAGRVDQKVAACVAFSCAVAVLLVFAKYFTYPMFGLCVGLYGRLFLRSGGR